MNLPNVVVLVLVVLALNFVLLFVVLPASELIAPAVESAAVAATHAPIEKPTFFNELLVAFSWLLGASLWVILGAPAILLSVGAFAVWSLVGRPRLLEARHQASLEEERESLLQGLLTEVVSQLGGRVETGRGTLCQRLLPAQLRLDAQRLRRLAAFFQQSSLDEEDGATVPLQVRVPDRQYAKSANLASVLALVFFLLASFGLFWGSMIGAFSAPLSDLCAEVLGVTPDPRFGLLGMALLWGLSISPAALGLGFRRMARLDRELAERWQQARRQAGRILLDGYRKQVEILKAHDISSPMELERVGHVITALTSVTLPELEVEGRRACLEHLPAGTALEGALLHELHGLRGEGGASPQAVASG